MALPLLFPVLLDRSHRLTYLTCPRTVPWSFVEPLRAMALKVHDQTLERLAERGGLDPVELWGLANNVNVFRASATTPSLESAVQWLISALKAYDAT